MNDKRSESPSENTVRKLARGPQRTFKMTVAYDGTGLHGWQLQPKRKTVQGLLQEAVRKITGETVAVVASGRTDAGVHALGQVTSFRSRSPMPVPRLSRALNAVLPEEIAVMELLEADESFHALRDAVRKRYRYVYYDGPARDVFRRLHCWRVRAPLDVDVMNQAARALLGEHDFSSFESSGSPRASSVRIIHALEIQRATGEDASLVRLEVEANGFLYNMVRAIAGTLEEIGRGFRTPESLPETLLACNRGAAGKTAPAHGLCLVRVMYEEPSRESERKAL
ncbi:MAG: tRNA pseudouridine(38-40) synthase TruA [Planctomycetales bacterium]